MTSRFLNLLIFFIATFTTVHSQNRIIIGTVDTDNFEIDKQSPYIGFAHFYKENNKWCVLGEAGSSFLEKQRFNVYYRGSNKGVLFTKSPTLIGRFPLTLRQYKFTTKNIPEIGRLSDEFSGMADRERYRPLVISNSQYGRQKNGIKYRTPNKKDSSILYTYLKETALELKLGNVDTIQRKIIKKINKVLLITNDCYLIDADINLNMYCYEEKVPFDEYPFSGSTEKNIINEGKCTYNTYFLINKAKVSYIDYNLKYVDSGDYDNDGFDEIIFKIDKYNYTAYLMITNKWNDFLINSWKYH